MGHEVFEWVIAIAVLIVFISNLAFLWLFYVKVSPLIDKLQATSDRLNPILTEAQGIMSHAKDIAADIKPIVIEAQGIARHAKDMVADIKPVVADVRPVVHNVAAKTNDITDMVHAQATEIRGLMQDNILPKVRDQVERLDDLVTRTTDKVNATTGDIEKRVIEPIVTTTNDVTDMVRAQVIEFRTLMQDTASRVRDQVDQLDDLIRRANSRIGDSITNIERQVTSPVREANYVETAVRKGLSALFNRDKTNRDKIQAD